MELPALFLFLSMSQFVISSAVDPICIPNTKPYVGPKLPKLPEQFSTFIEVANQEKMGEFKSLVVAEHYDKMANRGAFEVLREGKKHNSIFNYDTDEHFFIDLEKRTCKVEKIKKTAIFGPGSGGQIRSVNDVFKFGNGYPLEYLNTTHIRSIKCHLWRSCRQDGSTTYLTEYYFSDPSITMAAGKQSVLVLMNLQSQTNLQNGSANYTKMAYHSYNFVSFLPGKPKAEHFQTPPGIFCPGQASQKATPSMPPEFETSIEMVDINKTRVRNVREFYDLKERYFRFDHINRKSGKPERVIQDFNTGLVYMIDSDTYECTIKPLNQSWVGTTDDPEHRLRLKKSDELFHLENGGQRYKYEGFRNVRNIGADVWIGHVNWTRSGNITRTKYEWHFSRDPWQIHSDISSQVVKHVPLQLRIYRGRNDEHLFLINFFNYATSEPSSHMLWPVKDCFWENRHYIYFRLDGSYDTFAHRNEYSVRRGIRDALSKAGKVSKFRVSGLMIFKSAYNGVVAVRVYVFGVPSVTGGKVLHPRHTIPLKDAVDGIRKTIRDGKLRVTLKVKGVSHTLTAQRNSYYETDKEQVSQIVRRRSEGLGVGQVIGVTLGVIFIAVLLTILAIYAVLKRKDVNLFSYLRFK